MKEVIKKAEELFDAVTKKNVELDGLLSKNKELIEGNKSKREELKAKEDSLKAREDKIRKVEDIVTVKEASDKRYFAAKKIEKENKIQIDAFAKYESDQKKQLQADRTKLEAEKEKFETEKKKSLDVEREKIRKEFMAELASKSKKSNK